ncbi:hypothetical protein [Rhizobium sp. MHM7A]|uniref:hypothetical protein n=1 Tax=Rhizobium sp. MHM7A TaxID=2583233 RepID=UPI0011073E86|nr:hypothetical protein [Rhizobium sp. MHM7A]TLX17074.1 hypothetical protein FFR93_07105 [Rhizobium sp. MHM7A]
MIDYSRLEFDEQTTNNLFDFCLAHRLGLADIDDQSKLRVDEFKFHMTIMYSKVMSPLFREGLQEFTPHILQPETFAMFGPNEDMLVLKLHCDDVLNELFMHYRSVYGHVSDFMPFRPHITMRGNSAGVRERIKTLPLPEFAIRADRLIHKVKTA